MNVKNHLTKIAESIIPTPENLQLPDCEIDTAKIKVIMINEVPPQNPSDGFYSSAAQSNYMETTLRLFNNAGVDVKTLQDILSHGIYITTAVKAPKTGYTVAPDVIKAHLPILAEEIAMLPNLKVIMLMGDVAKKCVNMITKAQTKKNIIPSEATYKIRSNEYYWNNIRVFPSYIMKGGNILIEKSKCDMISDDIRRMMAFI